MFSLLQEINMFGARQTARLRRVAPLPFNGPPLGALTADVRKRINKQRFSLNQHSTESTVENLHG